VRNPGTIALTVTILIAIIGGIYIGQFSCGGYLVVENIFDDLFHTALIFLVLIKSKSIVTFLYSLFYVGISFGLFFIARAGSGAFYPSIPSNLNEFIKNFKEILLYDIC